MTPFLSSLELDDQSILHPLLDRLHSLFNQRNLNNSPPSHHIMSSQPVWFITAASSGFGYQIALHALSLSHVVIATARDPSRISDLAAAGAHTMALDVTAPESELEAAAADVFARFGRVEYLINAAGYILEGAVEEVSSEELQRSFDTNVFGTVKTIGAFLNAGMRTQEKRLSDGKRATVVTFGSLGSWVGGASFSVYAMTKACVSSLAESLREELAPFDIVATAIEPGYFRTNFLRPGNRVSAARRIAAYEDEATPTGMVRRALTKTDGNQPGDVEKGARVVVEVLTGTEREVPMRIVLGKDCEAVVRGKCESTLMLLEEWKDVIRSTDHE